MDVTVAAVIVAAVATLVGASIQGSIGFGMNLVTVPALALVLPDALPATVILIGLPLAVIMFRHEHHALDRDAIGWILAGRVPGTILGAIIVAALTADELKGVIGVFVLFAVAISVFAPPVPMNHPTEFTAGMVAGTTGTAAGIGGPPLALLYQHHEGPTMRSTLAASFLFGTLLSIITLSVAHQMHLADLWLALGLSPLVFAGSRVGRHITRYVDGRVLRPAVLVFAAVSAIVVIVDALN
ncbi:MAG TPA: sulfite exporter TauE/SafE family protein [Acidimicrobiia bacterium]|nr:sulfite exporter TauE/SafE family protein [Acidimicrobiia bacterium]